MPRFIQRDQNQPEGKLLIEEVHPNCVEVFYIPPDEKLVEAGLDPNNAENLKAKILLISGQDDYITIFPINTLGGHNEFLESKYNKIKSITLDGIGIEVPEDTDGVMEILEDLPPGFVKDYEYGLGLQKDYRFIIHAIEEMGDITDIVIGTDKKTEILDEEGICNINFNEYDQIRKGINRITNRAQLSARRVKAITAHNMLVYYLGSEKYSQKILQTKNDTLHNLIADVKNNDGLSKADQKEVVKLISKNKKNISKEQPEALAKLHDDIELVTLERLIEKYDEMLGKKLNEDRWQALFSENPFILSLAFGYPVIKIQDQASVGGRKLSGAGDKITDFLVKNNITNNTAIFEIKKPTTKLLNKKPYREGIYTPSSELSGAVNQLVDQKYKFQKEISVLKENTRVFDMETYAVLGVLIVGQTPGDVDQQKSFELFRGNSKDIAIITFDELLEKLKQLYSFLI